MATYAKRGDFASREIIYFGQKTETVLDSNPFSPTDPNQPSPSARQRTPSSSTFPNQPIHPFFSKQYIWPPIILSNSKYNTTQLATMIPTVPQSSNSPVTEVPTTIRPTSSPTPETFKPNIRTEGIFQSQMSGY